MGEYTNKIAGKTKKVAGKATGNRRLQAKGALQETVGKVQGGAKRVKKAVKRGVRRGTRPSRRQTDADDIDAY